MGLPWWAWALLGLVAFYGVYLLSITWFRRRVRTELLAFLAAEAPELRVLEVREDRIRLALPHGDDGVLHLHRLYDNVARLKPSQTEARRDLFRSLLDAVRSTQDLTDTDPAEIVARLRPRLITEQRRAALEAEAGGPLVGRPVVAGSLAAVIVLDSPTSVRYLAESDIAARGLAADDCIRAATDNIRADFSREPVSRAMQGDVVVLQAEDGHAAARLLLVPDQLEPGERLFAVVPEHEDALLLAAYPDDPGRLRRIGPFGQGVAVQVTKEGFAAA